MTESRQRRLRGRRHAERRAPCATSRPGSSCIPSRVRWWRRRRCTCDLRGWKTRLRSGRATETRHALRCSSMSGSEPDRTPSRAWRLSERMPSSRSPARDRQLRPQPRRDRAWRSTDEHAAAFGFDGRGTTSGAHALLAKGRHETPRTSLAPRPGRAPIDAGARAGPSSTDVVFWGSVLTARANPALWTVAAFEALRRLCRAGDDGPHLQRSDGDTVRASPRRLRGWSKGATPRATVNVGSRRPSRR